MPVTTPPKEDDGPTPYEKDRMEALRRRLPKEHAGLPVEVRKGDEHIEVTWGPRVQYVCWEAMEYIVEPRPCMVASLMMLAGLGSRPCGLTELYDIDHHALGLLAAHALRELTDLGTSQAADNETNPFDPDSGWL